MPCSNLRAVARLIPGGMAPGGPLLPEHTFPFGIGIALVSLVSNPIKLDNC